MADNRDQNDFLRNPPPGPAHDDGKQTPPTDQGDDIPDTPGTEPKPVPIEDPKPRQQPQGPYVA